MKTAEHPQASNPGRAPGGAKLRSCLYECRVLHHRLAPREHRFVYSLFYFAFDLDELDALDRRLSLLRANRAGVFSFRERDFLPLAEPVHHPEATHPPTPGRATQDGASSASLKDRVRAFCAQNDTPTGDDAKVILVTLPRLFGHQFNPVSFYFCLDAAGAPLAAIAEVTNTFREVKFYFVPLAPRGGNSPGNAQDVPPAHFRLRVPKDFYVSPFTPVDAEFDFLLRLPSTTLAARVDDHQDGRRVLHTTLTGSRIELTDLRLAAYLLKYPLVTLKIVAGIHWQALRLWLKRLPLFPKTARADRQRDLRRPHVSITGPLPS